MSLVGDRFIALYLQDASTEVKLFALDGKFVQDVQLPGIGTAAGFTGKRHDGKRTDHGDVLQLLQPGHAAEHLPARPGHAARAA